MTVLWVYFVLWNSFRAETTDVFWMDVDSEYTSLSDREMRFFSFYTENLTDLDFTFAII